MKGSDVKLKINNKKFLIAVLISSLLFSSYSLSATNKKTDGATTMVKTNKNIVLNNFKVHYHPKTGWMNDPNGLSFNGKNYNMFYQYYPTDTVWGPMHWGHAISNDLIKWEEQRIALYPDHLGMNFSGSAVIDKDNTSGFFNKNTPVEKREVIVYTSHYEQDGKREEMQSVAYLSDNGNYKRYENNPVIAGNGRKDFRDPKIFYYEKDKKWVMIVSAAQKAELYESKNLKDWKKLSDFNYDFKFKHIWECPDLIQVDGKWILIGSIINEDDRINGKVLYFVGEFDGKKFTPDENKYEVLDYGRDFYAPQSIYGAKKPTAISWLNNWVYATKIPAKDFRSIMGIPRVMSFKNGKLYQEKVDTFKNYITNKKDIKNADTMGQNVYFDLQNTGNFDLELFKDANGSFNLSYQDGKLRVKREKFGSFSFNDKDLDRQFLDDVTVDIALKKVNIVVDSNVVEIFANDGEKTFSYLVYPDNYSYKFSGDVKDSIYEIR